MDCEWCGFEIKKDFTAMRPTASIYDVSVHKSCLDNAKEFDVYLMSSMTRPDKGGSHDENSQQFKKESA